MKIVHKSIGRHAWEQKIDRQHQRDVVALGQKMTPNVITTEGQLQKLSKKFRFQTHMVTNNDIINGYEIEQSKDSIDNNALYVPYDIKPEDQKLHGNCKVLFYIFATDRQVCKRISKITRTKLIWESYNHDETENLIRTQSETAGTEIAISN